MRGRTRTSAPTYLARSVVEESRLTKGTAGKYRTAKGHYYDCTSVIEALVLDEYREVPYPELLVHTEDSSGNPRYVIGYELFRNKILYRLPLPEGESIRSLAAVSAE